MCLAGFPVRSVVADRIPVVRNRIHVTRPPFGQYVPARRGHQHVVLGSGRDLFRHWVLSATRVRRSRDTRGRAACVGPPAHSEFKFQSGLVREEQLDHGVCVADRVAHKEPFSEIGLGGPSSR